MSNLAKGQQKDNVWLVGYADSTPEPNDNFGISEIRFLQFGKKDTIDNPYSTTFFDGTDVSISDSIGNLLFYYEGFNVYDASHQIMLNGDSLSRTDFSGSNINQGAVILPFTENENLYALFHMDGKYVAGVTGYIGTHLYRSIIDMSLNNGLGAVVDRKKIILEDNLYYGRMQTVRHANGRDWWILLPNQINGIATGMHSILLSPADEVQVQFREFENPIVKGLGQSVVSPDGSQYAITNTVDLNLGPHVSLFNFDRCSGEIFNQRNRVFIDPGVYSTGISFSSNSRLLYVTAFDKIYQFDTYEENPLDHEFSVATYDGFLDSIFPVPTWFYLCQLAPDGKIYISIPNGARFLHHIDFPNRHANDCKVIQHGTQLPNFNGGSLPYFSNFRLGPIDGSLCDTIGINNIPLANFRSDQEVLDSMSFEFTDLSAYEPDYWMWEFGDGNSSDEINPKHSYTNKGAYQICLTVSNEYGSHTSCDSLQLGKYTSTQSVSKSLTTVFPNPCKDYILVRIEKRYSNSIFVEVGNIYGQTIKKGMLDEETNLISLENFPDGVYTINVWDQNILITSKVIFKM